VFKVDFATAWRSKSFEEVPIKHGHANGGFTAQRAREIGCWERSARAARAIPW